MVLIVITSIVGVTSVGGNTTVDGVGRRWTLDEVLCLGHARTRDRGAVRVWGRARLVWART